MSSNAIELVRKLVPRVVMEAGIEKPKAAESLYTIYGVVTALKDGTSDYGTFTKLIGQFEATRVSDRKVFRAPVTDWPVRSNARFGSQGFSCTGCFLAGTHAWHDRRRVQEFGIRKAVASIRGDGRY